MSIMDFNDAGPQRSGGGDLIPDGTIAIVVATLRPGQVGDDGWLRASGANPKNHMLDFEFTVDGGEFDRRKFWTLLSFADPRGADGDKQLKSANGTRATLRAMLESAFNIQPGDDSQGAMAKRQPSNWGSFDGLRFCAQIGIELGGVKVVQTGEKYPDKNKLASAVTPDDPDYIAPGPHASRGTPAQARPTAKPAQAPAVAAAKSKPAWAA